MATELIEKSNRNVLQIEYRDPSCLKEDPDSARKHTERQIKRLMGSYIEFGMIEPVLINPVDVVISGHARVIAARRLALKLIPTIRLPHLSRAQEKALSLALNKIHDLSYF